MAFEGTVTLSPDEPDQCRVASFLPAATEIVCGSPRRGHRMAGANLPRRALDPGAGRDGRRPQAVRAGSAAVRLGEDRLRQRDTAVRHARARESRVRSRQPAARSQPQGRKTAPWLPASRLERRMLPTRTRFGCTPATRPESMPNPGIRIGAGGTTVSLEITAAARPPQRATKPTQLFARPTSSCTAGSARRLS